MVKITEGKINTPIKCVVYGAEGIGKSTLASKMPGAVFFDLEGGTNRLDVKRVSTRFTSVDEIITAMAEVVGMGVQTIVIDTLDALDLIIIKAVCKKYGKDGIESFGYGKGYTYVAEEMKRFLDACDGVISRGVNVTLLAHAKITKFEQPDEMGAYDRWSLKLTKTSAPLVKEWADLLLFCNFKTTVVKTDENKKKVIGGERVMYSTHHSCWDAKNRFDLPSEMPLSFDSISKIYEGEKKAVDFGTASVAESETKDGGELPFDIGEAPPQEVESTELRALRSMMKGDGITEDQILKAFKGKYSAIENIEPEQIIKLLDKWEELINYIKGGTNK